MSSRATALENLERCVRAGEAERPLHCVTRKHILHTLFCTHYSAHILKERAEMTANRAIRSTGAKRRRTAARARGAPKPARGGSAPLAPGAGATLEEARRAGLLDGDKTEHVSFRAPPALVEAARRETGLTSPTELGILALATLAQPDPVAAFLKRTRARLGATHTLDY